MAPGLLVVNARAGSLGEAEIARLAAALPGYRLRRLEASEDLAAVVTSRRLAPASAVLVAGGDGTVGAAARALAGTGRVLGIVPAGTFNNFARSLGLPADLEAACAVIRAGRTAVATVGRVNGLPFLEVAAAGLFGGALALGETVKELRFGQLGERLAALAATREFEYRVTGDADLAGRSFSLLVANTPSTGAGLPVGETTPEDPYLELAVGGERHRVRRVAITTEPAVPVFADAAEAGTTPAMVDTVPGGLRVIVP